MAIQLETRTGVDLKGHSFTLDEFDRMVISAVFDPESNIELIRGTVVDMPPTGPEHEATVSRLHMFLGEHLRRRAILWPQGNSIGMPQSNSRPQPDVTLLKWREDHYSDPRPTPEDVVLLVEVSDSTLKYDQSDKLRVYAEAGIKEYWVVNLVEGVIETYTDPDQIAAKYGNTHTAIRGQKLKLPGDLDGEIEVSDILGRARK